MNDENNDKEYSGFVDAALKYLNEEKGITNEEIQKAKQRWSKPLSPQSKDIQMVNKEKKPFSYFFRKSKSLKYDYCLKYPFDKSKDVFLSILVIGRKYGVIKEEIHQAMPGIFIETLERKYKFLDGGFYSRSGNDLEPKGAWLWGNKTIRLICYELNIAQHRSWNQEYLPSYEELVEEVKIQHKIIE